ncbi:MAG: PAS domain S-box protein, partial [Acidimicrobiia bacterium]
MTATVATWKQAAPASQLAETLLRFRTYLYGSVAALMLVASIANRLERLTALVAFTLAVLAPLLAARDDPGRRIELAVVADLAGAFAIWWSLPDAPIVSLLLVLWAVGVISLMRSTRTTRMLMALVIVFEVAKLPISIMQRGGWFPWVPEGTTIAEPFSLVISSGGEIAIVSLSALVFRWLSTAQRDALERARLTEDQMRTVFRSPVTASVLISAEGDVVAVNDSAAELLGVAESELVGTSLYEMLTADDRSYLQRFAAVAAESPEDSQRRRLLREIELTLPSGATVWVMVSVACLEGAGDEPLTFFAVLQDMTERREAEEALRRSEHRYRTFFEMLPIAMYRTSLEGEILDGNQALAELLGYQTPAQLNGLDARNLYVVPEDRDNLRARLDGEGVALDDEYRLYRRDGTAMWVRDTSRIVDAGDGEMYEGALVDITERRSAARRLETAASRQEAVAHLGRLALENPDISAAIERAVEILAEFLDADGVWVLEVLPDGRLMPSAKAGVTGSSVPFPVLALASNALDMAGEDPHSAPMRPDGCAVVIPGPRSSFGVIVAVGGGTFCGEDVPFLQALAGVLGAAAERAKALARLEQLVKSKDEFIAAISHEVRTPLTVVGGMAQELQGGWDRFGTEEIREFVDLIVDQAREMEDLVEDLLVAARADIGKVSVNMQEVDLVAEIQHVLTSLAISEDRIRTSPTGAMRAYADPVRVRQIVRNLLTNAVRYGGDSIDIRIACQETTVTVQVEDDGAGIPDAKRTTIFEAYERAHEVGSQPGSVGLG